MRGLFGLVGLLLVLAIVGMLVKSQLHSLQKPLPALQLPASGSDTATAAPSDPNAPPPTVKAQTQAIQQQYKQAIEAAMQKTPAMPTDDK